MSDLPLPLPDRRLLLDLQAQNYKSTYINNYQNQNNEQSETINKNTIISETQEGSSFSIVKLKQIEDMRKKILN